MARAQRLLIGIVGLAIVFLLRDTLRSFFDLPSLMITVGGTLAVTYFSYSWETLRGLVAVVHTVLTTTAVSLEAHARKIIQLAQLNHTGGLRALENHEQELQDPLLRRAVSMIVHMRHEDEVRAMVEHEFFLFAHRYEATRQVLLTIGKLLPSFGMVGTLIGLVLLLRQAADPDPQTLAPALAVAVLTTLYGAVFSNVLALPLAAKLQVFIHDQEMLMRLTVEGGVLIARNQSPALVEKRIGLLVMHGELLEQEQLPPPRQQPRLALSHRSDNLVLSSHHSTQSRQFMAPPQRPIPLPRWRVPDEGEGSWWSVTFSDLVLVLLCFVVLWHVADKRRQQRLILSQEAAVSRSQEMREAPEATAHLSVEPSVKTIQPQSQSYEQTEALLPDTFASSPDVSSVSQTATPDTEWQELQSEIHRYIAEQGLDRSVGVISTEQGLVISLSDTITFPSGQATLNEAVMPFLSQVAALASERTTLDIEIAGHTDDRPIATPEFPSNWELSAARASRVARLLLEQEHIDPTRVSTRGHAHFRPLYANDTREHRAANRRVEIRFFRRVETLGGYDYEW